MPDRVGQYVSSDSLCNRLRAGVRLSLEGDWDFWWGARSFAAQLVQKRPVALEIGGAVVILQQGLLLVLCFLANVQLDVPFQQLDDRVEGVISAALISLWDEGSHDIWESVAIVPNITAADVVFSGVAEGMPEDFRPSRAGGWQRCFSEFPLCLCSKSFPVSLAEVRKRTSFPWRERGVPEGETYGEVVGPKSGPHRIREEIPAQKGDIWREGRSWFATASCELLIAPSRASPLAAALSFPVLEN